MWFRLKRKLKGPNQTTKRSQNHNVSAIKLNTRIRSVLLAATKPIPVHRIARSWFHTNKATMSLQAAVAFGLLVNVFSCASAARILGIVPTPSFSHQVAFQNLWRELSLRGHQVTLLTTHPIGDPSLTNLTEIDLSFTRSTWNNIDFNGMASLSPYHVYSTTTETMEEIMIAQLSSPQVQEILRDKTKSFDLVMIEGYFLFLEAFAERFKCPFIQLYSVDVMDYTYRNLGNPSHPALYPDMMLPYAGKLSFFERLSSVAYKITISWYFDYYILPKRDEQINKYFGDNYPPLIEILRNVSMAFTNTDPIFHPVRPLLPNVIQIGGGLHLKHPKPLPKKWQNILDRSSKGVIYFSLGNNVKSKHLSKEKVDIILKVFADLPYTILWKFELSDLSGKPNNVHLSNWYPQQDILRHPNIKLFITQGGLQSVDEAFYNHVPIIGMPFIADQAKNVKRAAAKGLGVLYDFSNIDENSFKKTILEVANNPKYRNRAKELTRLLKDQPMTGLERAMWWTEHVIRHKGARHLRSPALDLQNYQYYLLDVILFCLVVVSVTLYVIVKAVKVSASVVLKLTKRKKLKKL